MHEELTAHTSNQPAQADPTNQPVDLHPRSPVVFAPGRLGRCRRTAARVVIAAVAVIAAALITGTPGALAAGPCGANGQFSQSGGTTTCTYTNPGTEDTYTVPGGVSNVSVTAIGAPGGVGLWGGPGGLGAKVSNTALPVTPGAGLWVDVGAAGGNFPPSCGIPPLAYAPGGSFDGGTGGLCSGGGGGSSALLTTTRASATLTGDVASDPRLLVAAGGGGGAQIVGGGSAGDPSATGAGAGGCAGTGGAGGVGPTDGTNGAGAGNTCFSNPSCDGGDGTPAVGGVGAPFCTGGGAGGGGWFGGGGASSNGGGGGGSSYGGAGPSAGISIATASSTDAPQVMISYAASPPTVSITTPVNGATYAQGQVVPSSFSCTEGAPGPGIKSCLDQNGDPSGTAIDTSTSGQHTFTVTATSNDGLTGQARVTYTVSNFLPAAVSNLPQMKAPTAATDVASNVAYTSASLNGIANPNGSATTYDFQYGTSTAYGKKTTPQNAGSDTKTHPETASISGLAPGISYHYRIVAHNAAGTSEGGDQTFTTPERPLKLSLSPRRTQAGVRACFAFKATSTGHPIARVTIHLAAHTARTSHAGTARICLTLHGNTYHPRATKPTYRTAHTTITATPTPHRKPSFTG